MNLSDRSRTLIESSSALPRALVAAIGVGVAFGAGLVVGGIGEAEASPGSSSSSALSEPSDPLARAEARTKAYEALLQGTQLTWHKELSAVDPQLPAPPTTAKTTTTKPVAAPLSESPSSSPIVDKAVVQAPPEPGPVVKKADAAKDADDADNGADNNADTNEGAAAPDPKRLDAAMARVLGNAPKTESTTTADQRPVTAYAVQLASTSTEAAARVMADGWKQRGQKADVVAAEVAGRGTMYRVRIGGIASRAAADALKLKLGQGLVVSD